ncbi:unnamed protein product [Cylicocyclus nassatus]|uniref:Uncharacterized protein n=1 Tax=Cylicocyclus nassatus TaxID=53992 RepID=A0AA36HD80_CYLNA|nr:unnamed protein product [Cylicocyclus nassatus]
MSLVAFESALAAKIQHAKVGDSTSSNKHNPSPSKRSPLPPRRSPPPPPRLSHRRGPPTPKPRPPHRGG